MLNTIAALPIVLGLLSYASATPIHHQEGSCSEPLIRKEWRNLTSTQKKDYIGAIKCLQAKPKEVTPDWLAPAAVTRYDDFTTAHILQTNTSHKVGHLLPWHRYYLSVYERALREECNYAGAVPYWDWTLDVATDESFFNSPVFDPINGFGGNGVFIPTSKNKSSKESFEIPGRTGGGCIQNGPFKDDIITLGPTSSLSGNPRCLNRDLSPYWARRYIGLNRTKVTLEKSTFGDFTFDAELGPPQIHSGIHGGGHSGVGGIMRDPYVSPADPLFYLHHANLDRVWWSWQKRDLEKRLKDISGPIYKEDWNNTQGGNITLDFQMTMGYVAGTVTIRDVMDVRGEKLCYDYDTTYD